MTPSRFQFHAGSIKSPYREMLVDTAHTCFNSTLVLLKDSPRRGRTAERQRFNSTLVLLKDPRIKMNPYVGSCFNSTLVLLKGATKHNVGTA